MNIFTVNAYWRISASVTAALLVTGKARADAAVVSARSAAVVNNMIKIVGVSRGDIIKYAE